MPRSLQSALEIKRSAEEHGIATTAVLMGVQENTVRRALRQATQRTPRVLLMDLETAPMVVNVWGLYKQRIHHDNILKDWSILSWSAKWLNESSIISQHVTPEEAFNRQDISIIVDLWELFNDADIVIAHNLRRFDNRKAKARFIDNGLAPPNPYQMVDTLKECQKHFAFASHKQDFITKHFGMSEKINTEFGLWKRCCNDDGQYTEEEQRTALKDMEVYNRGDVRGLEDIYLKIRPYINSHPNMGLYCESDVPVCPNCGSEAISYDDGLYYYTHAGRFRAFRCECGAIGRLRFSDLSKEEKEKLTISIAR